MAKSNVPSIDEALAGMAATGAPRVPVGKVVPANFRNASADAAGPKQVKKNIGGSADPIVIGPERNARSHVLSTSGASYGIKAMMCKTTSPEAGKVTANGRLLPSAIPRTTRAAFDGASSNYN